MDIQSIQCNTLCVNIDNHFRSVRKIVDYSLLQDIGL